MGIVKRSHEEKLYRNTATYGTPTWEEIAIAKDVTVNEEVNEEDATAKDSGGFEETASVDHSISIEFQSDKRTDATGKAQIEALKAIMRADTLIDVVACDGDIATVGTKGIRFTGQIRAYNNPQPIRGKSVLDWVIKPAPNTDANPEDWETT